jgi:hypothetical protein
MARDAFAVCCAANLLIGALTLLLAVDGAWPLMSGVAAVALLVFLPAWIVLERRTSIGLRERRLYLAYSGPFVMSLAQVLREAVPMRWFFALALPLYVVVILLQERDLRVRRRLEARLGV